MKVAKTVLIAGPTASGKSRLALEIAEQIGGTIINADSMQVYSELCILTARPSAADEARVPHALYGHVPAREPYSAGRFVADASAAIEAARAADRTPVVVGGTGLYFKALLEGLSPIPPISDGVRTHWRSEGQRKSAVELHEVLSYRDAEMAARLNPTDTQRIVRALEVIEETGTSLAEWQRQPGMPVINEADSIRFVVQIDRAELHRRADARFDAMLALGALDEVRALAEQNLDPALPAMRAIGVSPLIRAATGEIAPAAAAELAKAETRQLIKRQETWLSRHMMSWKYVSEQQMESIGVDFVAFIQS